MKKVRREVNNIICLLYHVKKIYNSISGETDLNIIISGNSIHINNRVIDNVRIDLCARTNVDHIDVLDFSSKPGRLDQYRINLDQQNLDQQKGNL